MAILIVDDLATNRELLKIILEDYDYPCIIADSGQATLELLDTEPTIELILMDIRMPVMNGIETCRQIKSHYSDRFIPVIFVTALDEEDQLAECISAGGEDFILKPISERLLIAKVSAHMRTVALYNQLEQSHRELSLYKIATDREHLIVDHIFRNSIHRISTRCPNLSIHCSPLSMFNGDLVLSAPSGSGGVYVLLGDFTGHGLAAAMGCMPVADIFYAMTRKRASLTELASELNFKLRNLLPDSMFFCAALIEMSSTGRRLTYWSGGMNDLLVIRPDGRGLQRIGSQHMPLSILNDQEFDASVGTAELEPGSYLLMYTDGVIESRNGDGELFGEERLQALLENTDGDYLQAMVQGVNEFRGTAEKSDDLSIVQLRCDPIDYPQPSASHFQDSSRDYQRLPWRMHFHLGPEDLKKPDIILSIIRHVEFFEPLRQELDVLFLILSELYNNSLEHGLLALDSDLKASSQGFDEYYNQRQQRLDKLVDGFIQIEMSLSGASRNLLQLKLSDSCNGYHPSVHAMQADISTDAAAGRGIFLVRNFCESLSYEPDGTVTALYRLD